MTTEKVVCGECGWHGTTKTMLRAPNPFEPDDEVTGCASCRAVSTLEYACEHQDCWRPVSCGTPTADGYRQLCGQHFPTSATQEKP